MRFVSSREPRDVLLLLSFSRNFPAKCPYFCAKKQRGKARLKPNCFENFPNIWDTSTSFSASCLHHGYISCRYALPIILRASRFRSLSRDNFVSFLPLTIPIHRNDFCLGEKRSSKWKGLIEGSFWAYWGESSDKSVCVCGASSKKRRELRDRRVILLMQQEEQPATTPNQVCHLTI